jgi:DNA polymerase III epsilon subunit-like protein
MPIMPQKHQKQLKILPHPNCRMEPLSSSKPLKPIRPILELNTKNMRTVTRRNNQSIALKPTLYDLRKKILVFDTETTGFFSTRIVQLAYCKYYKTGVNHSQHSYYVKQLSDAELISIIKHKNPDMVDFEREIAKARYSEKEAQKIHQIPFEIINDASLPSIKNVLQDFYDALYDVELIVGHNVLYDLRIVYLEAERLNYTELMDKMRSIPYLDTMKMGKNVVKMSTKDGKKIKMPNLGELYKKLFPKEPDVLGFHNAIVDVDVTARCYFTLMNRDVFSSSNVRASPHKYVPKPAPRPPQEAGVEKPA